MSDQPYRIQIRFVPGLLAHWEWRIVDHEGDTVRGSSGLDAISGATEEMAISKARQALAALTALPDPATEWHDIEEPTDQ